MSFVYYYELYGVFFNEIKPHNVGQIEPMIDGCWCRLTVTVSQTDKQTNKI